MPDPDAEIQTIRVILPEPEIVYIQVAGLSRTTSEWGTITGTLSDQTDLQAALDLKENLANKSTDVNLGASNTLYPTQNAVKTYVDNNASGSLLASNVARVDPSGNDGTGVVGDQNKPFLTIQGAIDALEAGSFPSATIDFGATSYSASVTTSLVYLAFKGCGQGNSPFGSLDLTSTDPVVIVFQTCVMSDPINTSTASVLTVYLLDSIMTANVTNTGGDITIYGFGCGARGCTVSAPGFTIRLYDLNAQSEGQLDVNSSGSTVYAYNTLLRHISSATTLNLTDARYTGTNNAGVTNYTDIFLKAVPPGGDYPQVLMKQGADPFDTAWQSIVPVGGLTGQVLAKTDDFDFDTEWIDPPSGPPSSGSQLISGGGVAWTGTGFNYIISAAIYLINGVQYASPQTPVTLSAAHATLDRIDTFYVDVDGLAGVITGTPGAPPIAPSVDPATQLNLTFAYIVAASTEPVLTVVNIYLENTEYTMSANAGTINVNSTNNPYAGTKCIEGTTTVTGNSFTAVKPSGTLDLSTFQSLIFQIRSKASWPNPKSLSIFWLNGAVVTGTSVALHNGVFGFDSSNTSTYQQIVIPISSFNTGSIAIDRLRMAVAGGGGAIGWYIDNIILQSGGGGPPGGGTGDFSTNTNIAVANEIVLFADATGKLGKRSTGTGIANVTSGALGTVTVGSGLSYVGSTLTATGSGGTVTSITATAPVVVTPSPLTTTGVISVTGAALTKTDDTNVTLTLGGTPTTALLQATSITAGWTGTLAEGRGGTGVSSLGDITKTDDTNVTLTLGGTPTDAVIHSTSFTLGWTGTLGISRGGFGKAMTDPNAHRLIIWDDTDGDFQYVTVGTNLSYDHATHTLSATGSAATHAVTLATDGSGAVLSTGTKNPIKIPYGGTLTGWLLAGTPSGSVTVDIFRSSDGAGLPVTSIVGAGTKPSLSGATEAKSTNFTSWTSTTLTAFDNLAISLSGITSSTYVSLTLYYA